MRKRKLRLRGWLIGVAALGPAVGFGCSLINTDDLTGGLPDGGAADGAPGSPEGSTSPEAAVDSGTVCSNGELLGTTTNCGTCGFDCSGGDCNAGVCQPVAMAYAGQGRALVDFVGTGLIWSTVTVGNQAPSSGCATVAPQVYGAATDLTLPDGGGTLNGVLSLYHSSSNAGYASALYADAKGYEYQDTTSPGGITYRFTGVGTHVAAMNLGGAVYGVAEPPGGGVVVFFSNPPATSLGPQEWGADGGVGYPGVIELDPDVPEVLTKYQTVPLAMDSIWVYYGASSGVVRVKLGAACTHPTKDAGPSSCDGTLVPEPSTVQVTAILVDGTFIFVATSDNALTRYNLGDGSNPLTLSSMGPFYGLTQDVNVAGNQVTTYGSTIVAASAAGPILEIAKDASTTKTLATSPRTPVGVVVDPINAYWVEDGDINTVSACAVGDGRLMRVRR